MTRIGITGSRLGLTDAQYETARKLLSALSPGSEVHHGDCVGADQQAHDIVREHSSDTQIVGHPPDKPALRAFCEVDVEEPPKQYLLRDLDIVKSSDTLLAFPHTTFEIRKSGTWATVRMARKHKVPVMIVWPNGSATTGNTPNSSQP